LREKGDPKMDNNVLEIKPVSLGPWIGPEIKDNREPPVSKIVRVEEGLLGNPGRESAAQSGQPQQLYSLDQTRELVNNAQSLLNVLNSSLSFIVYEKAGRVVVKVIDRNTKKVIREIPPEDIIRLKEKLQEVRGVLFNGEA
jgi:flagellar protein FlaG